jgi:formylmethanofuran dehydrogenase subunit E
MKRPSHEGLRIAVKGISSEETEGQKQIWNRFITGDRSDDVMRTIKELKASKIQRILSADEEELFKIEHITLTLPHEAKIYPSLNCSLCGEKMMEARARVKEGKIVCIPCFNKDNNENS